MTWDELLEDFKKNESAENLIPLIESDELRSGVVAWKSVSVEIDKSAKCEEDVESARWEWLWSKVNYDLGIFTIVAGVQAQNSQRLFVRLKGLRLIYPDGTINALASGYLQSIVLSKLPKKRN
jgi:hypothetical protein